MRVSLNMDRYYTWITADCLCTTRMILHVILAQKAVKVSNLSLPAKTLFTNPSTDYLALNLLPLKQIIFR